MTFKAYATTYRIIDTNLAGVSESLHVIEDLLCLGFNHKKLAQRLGDFRQRLRDTAQVVAARGIEARDEAMPTEQCSTKKNTGADAADSANVLAEHFQRVQQGLRSLETQFGISGHSEQAGACQRLRRESYQLERDAMAVLWGDRRRQILATDIYALTGAAHSRGRSNIEVVGAMIDAGIGLIQYREKDKSLAEQLQECRQIRRMTRDAGVRFIVNDDPALAVMAEADGIHLGQDDYPVAEVRRLVGETMAIGLSTHSPAQAEAACRAGVDYIGVGPIFQTFTKKDVCAPVGFDYLQYVVRNIELPFVAIGGIKAHNLAEVVHRGADCIAMVTEIVAAEDIRQTVSELKQIIQQARESRS